MRKHYICIPLLLAAAAFAPAVCAQDEAPAATATQTMVPALFEYPVAPAELTGLSEKSDWLVEHFWDSFDPKKTKVVDQAALNHAFSVYAVPFRWADKQKTLNSVDRLIASVSKNPSLLLQMTKAAEETLYGPRAEVWIDEIYVRFLEALVRNKKLKPIHKARYEFQLKPLSTSMTGQRAPSFKFTKPDGSPGFFTPTGNYTLIEFGDPGCHECSMAKLSLDTDVTIGEMLKTGKLNICFFTVSPEEGWQDELKAYPEKWVVGAAEEAEELYDMRLTPSLYLIGPDGTIRYKNMPVESMIAILKDLNSQS